LVKLTFEGLISPNSFLCVLVLSVFLLVQVKLGRYGWRFENYSPTWATLGPLWYHVFSVQILFPSSWVIGFISLV